jgi:hypothetical protein
MDGKIAGRGARTPDGNELPEPEARQHAPGGVRRRTLLTRGGIVVASVAGASMAGAAIAGPADAATGDPVAQNEVNSAGSSSTPTELDAANDTAPAFILTNTGVDTTNNGAGPNLRLTPSAATGDEPTASTAGGDLTATGDGTLWFTHDFTGETTPIFPAPVHTDATADVYAPLSAPVRMVDTRSSAGRKNIVNATGNLDSSGRLLKGHTIYVNLDTLVVFADAMFANLTVTKAAAAGFLTLWSGAGNVPDASSINFGANQTLSNFVTSGLAEYSSTILNVIAINASETTHVILDVAGFAVPGFEYVKVDLAAAASASSRAARLQRARQAMRAGS